MIYADSNILIRLLEGTPAVRAPIEARLLPFRGTGCFLATSRLSRLECRCKPLQAGDTILLALYEALFQGPEIQLVEITADVVEKATELRANSTSKRRMPSIWGALFWSTPPPSLREIKPSRALGRSRLRSFEEEPGEQVRCAGMPPREMGLPSVSTVW